MFLHLLNIPGILQSLVSFLIVFMLEVLNSFPQILNGLELGLAVLDENLEVLQSRDDFLHERGDLLRPMVVNQLLELLPNIRRDIVNINNVDIPILAVSAGHTAGPLCSSLHTRCFSYFISETPDMNELLKLET